MTATSVLFVDDEPRVTEALKRALRRDPYRVFSADSAAAGLELLGREEIDVVISDEKMPGMSGCEFLAEVRRKYPSIVRIMLTGEASMDAAISAINEGEVYRFFTKPCNPHDLRVTLRQAMLQKKLIEKSHDLLEKYRAQRAYIEDLESSSPGVLDVRSDHQGAIVVSEDDSSLDDLLDEMRQLFGNA